MVRRLHIQASCSTRSLCTGKPFDRLYVRPGEDEGPVGAQILGSNPETMAVAAESFANIGFDLIDLNFACPAPKVLRRHSGGYLLKEPETAIKNLPVCQEISFMSCHYQASDRV